MRQKWLIIAAHPDDESKASGLIFKERKPEDEVIVMVMRLCGEGIPLDRKSWTREEAIVKRSAEMKEAAIHLGASVRWWLQPSPTNENIVKTPKTVEKMIRILKEIGPTRIITHFGKEDVHPDHVGTAELVETAVEQLNFSHELIIYFFDEPALEQKTFTPNHYVDISDSSILASCLWSRCVHRSQINLGILRKYLIRYKEYGQKIGAEYAMAYMDVVSGKVAKEKFMVTGGRKLC